jgi:hypothetical protein
MNNLNQMEKSGSGINMLSGQGEAEIVLDGEANENLEEN